MVIHELNMFLTTQIVYIMQIKQHEPYILIYLQLMVNSDYEVYLKKNVKFIQTMFKHHLNNKF